MFPVQVFHNEEKRNGASALSGNLVPVSLFLEFRFIISISQGFCSTVVFNNRFMSCVTYIICNFGV